MAETNPEQTEKRCYYEVLGLPKTCTQDEIRSAYKKLALQRHPDKLIQSGTTATAATAAFQELVRAYEILSDPKERSWYDSHRSQILFSSTNGNNNGTNDSPFPDLFSYFSPSCYTDYTDSKTGFYKVYGDVFEKIYRHEVGYCRTMGLNLGLVKEAPLLGELGSDYGQVNAFYGYWLGFSTVMDFGWVDKWDAGAGVNRKSRRVMEEENKKVRKKAKKEFNETVRGLAEFVKKRDKRVIDMMVRKEKERERKRAEEVARRKEREREKLERARLYEEPDWAKVEDDEVEEEEEEEQDEEERKEFYCVACGKKFKSDKQWKNHEKSKKHKEKVEQLRKSFIEEDDFEEDINEEDVDDEGHIEDENVEDVNDTADNGFVSANEEEDDDLDEKFKECVEIKEEINDDEDIVSRNNRERNEIEESSGGSEDELIDLEAMISGRQNRKRMTVNNGSFDAQEPMEYNNKKGKKKSRRAKKEKGKFPQGGDGGDAVDEINGSDFANNGDDDQEDHDLGASTSSKAGKQSFGKKGSSKQDTESKSKNSSKGRKQKEKAKNRDPVCEKCAEEFESRSKLHKHLNETGHATLKS